MDSQLLSLLRCPETKGVLRTASPAELEKFNIAIRNSAVRNRNGEPISELLDDCLICDSAGLCYPVRDGLPLMLTGEAFDTPR
ncbi:MAG TPA: Trm112 family protein [Chthoniobacterales bacterium]|nr:Trm112 family protein [Chthoniobacterales bacterium]